MRKIAVIITITVALFIIVFNNVFLSHKTTSSAVSQRLVPTDISQQPTVAEAQKETQTLFVPYWTFDRNIIDLNTYDNIIYFGVSVNDQGIDTKEAGYKKLGQFNQLTVSSHKKYLAIRMTDSDINSLVLQNKNLQQKIADQAINIADKNGFIGLVLDFEVSSLGFESVTKEISSFYEQFYSSAKKQRLDFFVTVFGDSLYRARPYDIKTISQNADKVLIMSYDFHKARGNPGPNFPLSGKEIYGYDFKTMVSDFLKQIQKEKMVVVFGMFGYDWALEKENSIGQAQALSDLKIRQKFIDICVYTNCSVTRDQQSSETRVTYTDDQSQSHVIWFEDENSVAKKKEYLRQQGIGSIGFWAYSYF